MIRWIKERLGTGARDSIGSGNWTLLDVRFLVDKGGNPLEPVRDIIERGANAYRQGQTVVVVCDFGISRSNAIAAGIVSRVDAISYDSALRLVTESTAESEMKVELVETVRLALGESLHRKNPKAVLITGASGFIGSRLSMRLQSTCKVLSPSRSMLNLEGGAVALAEYCSREEVSQIVHLAYPRAYTNASAAGTSLVILRSVLDTCRLLKIHLIFVSSWAVFSGYSSSAFKADESTPHCPKGVYGETKYMEEMLVDLYFRRGEIDRSICRLGPVYGPGGDRPRFIRTFKQILENGEVVRTHRFRNGRPALDLLHVLDAVDALALVVAKKAPDVFHFGNGELRATADLAALISKILQVEMRHEEIFVDDDTSNIAFPAVKARAMLDWQPKVSIEEGIASMLKDEEEN